VATKPRGGPSNYLPLGSYSGLALELLAITAVATHSGGMAG
jgi:hypothetical protein